MSKKAITANLTPYLGVKSAKKAIEFYKKAFGAVEIHPIEKVKPAEMKRRFEEMCPS